MGALVMHKLGLRLYRVYIGSYFFWFGGGGGGGWENTKP